MDREDIKILIKKWWDIYEDESLDYKNTAGATEGGRQTFWAALSDGVVQYFTAPSAA